MPSCTVTFTGTDHKSYTETVEASSLFDAANKAMKRVANFWWWKKTHKVMPSKVVEWRNHNARPLG